MESLTKTVLLYIKVPVLGHLTFPFPQKLETQKSLPFLSQGELFGSSL